MPKPCYCQDCKHFFCCPDADNLRPYCDGFVDAAGGSKDDSSTSMPGCGGKGK